MVVPLTQRRRRRARSSRASVLRTSRSRCPQRDALLKRGEFRTADNPLELLNIQVAVKTVNVMPETTPQRSYGRSGQPRGGRWETVMSWRPGRGHFQGCGQQCQINQRSPVARELQCLWHVVNQRSVVVPLAGVVSGARRERKLMAEGVQRY